MKITRISEQTAESYIIPIIRKLYSLLWFGGKYHYPPDGHSIFPILLSRIGNSFLQLEIPNGIQTIGIGAFENAEIAIGDFRPNSF